MNKELKYLFTATFADGTVIEQTPEDRSAIDPEKRSQFFDVLEKEKQTPIVSFVLMGEGREYGVDLRDGHFEVNRLPFRMMEGVMPEYRLIFFRRHTHDFEVGSGSQTRHEVVYRIGWQCTVDGKNLQRVMEID